jgi:succinate dehydrogenase / fumarate reductase membrane anchor subunit
MNHSNYGNKRLVVGAHYGLSHWLIQRITATLMLVFALIVLFHLVLIEGPIHYEVWAGIFSTGWMKVLTFVVALALTYHVWVGVRDIWMDYIKPTGLRLTLHSLTAVWLVACLVWIWMILVRL